VRPLGEAPRQASSPRAIPRARRLRRRGPRGC